MGVLGYANVLFLDLSGRYVGACDSLSCRFGLWVYFSVYYIFQGLKKFAGVKLEKISWANVDTCYQLSTCSLSLSFYVCTTNEKDKVYLNSRGGRGEGEERLAKTAEFEVIWEGERAPQLE